MSVRSDRRAAERQASKLATKAGLPHQPPTTVAAAPESVPQTLAAEVSEPASPFLSLREITRVQNGNFMLVAAEDPAGFEALKQSMYSEHKAVTPTETILVDAMIESHWLALRSQRLRDACTDHFIGAVTDEKNFALYLRNHNTHTRAFHKALNALLKLRSERRKAEIGFEAQKIKSEQHAMKKQSHYWEVLKKDGEACRQISLNTIQNLKAREEVPGFEAQYAADLAKHGIRHDVKEDLNQTTAA